MFFGTAVAFKDAACRFNGRIDVVDLFRDVVSNIFQLAFGSSAVFNDARIGWVPGCVFEARDVFTALGFCHAIRFSTRYRLVADRDSTFCGIAYSNQAVVAVYSDSAITGSSSNRRICAVDDHFIGVAVTGGDTAILAANGHILAAHSAEVDVIVQGNLCAGAIIEFCYGDVLAANDIIGFHIGRNGVVNGF